MDSKYLQEKITKLQKSKRLKNDKKRFLELAIKYQQKQLNSMEFKELNALVLYEKSIDKVKENKKRILNVNKTKKLQENKKRNYNLMQVTNLLIIADLVDVNTGNLLIDKNSFLGALFSIQSSIENIEKMTSWRNKAIQFLQNNQTASKDYQSKAKELPFELTYKSDLE